MGVLLRCARRLWRTAFVYVKPHKRPAFAAGFLLSVCLVALGVAATILRLLATTEPAAASIVPVVSTWPRNAAEVVEVLNGAYDGLEGQTLRSDDVAKASEHGTFQKTYGEFAVSGVEVLLGTLNVTSDDVFCDLGSGTGKVVMQAYLQRRPREAIGIELSEGRHKLAMVARNRLLSLAPAVAFEPEAGTLTYVHGDVLDSDSTLARCNKIFFCSTVWPPELLERMERKFMSLDFLRKPVLVASSKQLKAFGGIMLENRFPGKARFVRQARVDTSWGASFISLYALSEV